jgi:hypothetical protein
MNPHPMQPGKPAQPPRMCPYCRGVALKEGELICSNCLERAKIGKLDALAEKAATEVLAQLTRFVRRGEMTQEDAVTLAWDMGILFAKEADKRKNPPKV